MYYESYSVICLLVVIGFELAFSYCEYSYFVVLCEFGFCALYRSIEWSLLELMFTVRSLLVLSDDRLRVDRWQICLSQSHYLCKCLESDIVIGLCLTLFFFVNCESYFYSYIIALICVIWTLVNKSFLSNYITFPHFHIENFSKT